MTPSAQQPPPAFKSSVEVTSLDVTVVDTNGRPIANLAPADFVVRIDNNVRRVVTAEWVQLTSTSDRPAPVAAPPEGYSSNENAIGGRLIVIAIDQPNIRFGGALAISKAANAFVDRLQPSDRIAVAGIGVGAPATTFTTDRARIKQAISRMAGQKTLQHLQNRNIGLSEALQVVERGDTEMLKQIQQRECATENSPGSREACNMDVEVAAADDGERREARGRPDVAGVARPVPRIARDRRAENADLRFRRLRVRPIPGWCWSSAVSPPPRGRACTR